MRTLLLVKYRDEPFAKTCIRYPFAATVEKSNDIILQPKYHKNYCYMDNYKT